MIEQAEVLSRPVNFAVVQLPERNFPGVVVQGDTLKALVRQIERMSELLAAGQAEDLTAEIEDVRQQFQGALTHFESVCAARGIALPYRQSTS